MTEPCPATIGPGELTCDLGRHAGFFHHDPRGYYWADEAEIALHPNTGHKKAPQLDEDAPASAAGPASKYTGWDRASWG